LEKLKFLFVIGGTVEFSRSFDDPSVLFGFFLVSIFSLSLPCLSSLSPFPLLLLLSFCVVIAETKKL